MKFVGPDPNPEPICRRFPADRLRAARSDQITRFYGRRQSTLIRRRDNQTSRVCQVTTAYMPMAENVHRSVFSSIALFSSDIDIYWQVIMIGIWDGGLTIVLHWHDLDFDFNWHGTEVVNDAR